MNEFVTWWDLLKLAVVLFFLKWILNIITAVIVSKFKKRIEVDKVFEKKMRKLFGRD